MTKRLLPGSCDPEVVVVVMEAVVVRELVISTTSVEAVTSTSETTATVVVASEVPKSWVTWHLVVVESMIYLSLCSCHEINRWLPLSHLITPH